MPAPTAVSAQSRTADRRPPTAPPLLRPTSPAKGTVAVPTNPLWLQLATGVQAKLAAGNSGDPDEHEADVLAERVTRVPDGSAHRACPACAANGPSCSGCEEKKPAGLARKPAVDGDGGAATLPTAAPAVGDAGRPLDMATRAYMEPRFGRDLSHVRVHTDAAADTAARSLQALAFTRGRDVTFRAGYYAPQSDRGKRLLAHELVHVSQQERDGLRVQRATEGFAVTEVQPLPEERTAGMAARFSFDIDQSEFREDVPAEATERARLEAWARDHTGKHVELVARASQEGSAARNQALRQQRAATVRGILVAHGVIVDRTSLNTEFTERPADYRYYRSVEVVVAGDPTCSNFTAADQARDLASCEAAFAEAHRRAVAIANAGWARVQPAADPAAAPGPDRDAVLNERFPGVSRAILTPRFQSVVTRISEVGGAANHVCHHRCADKCERPASAAAGDRVELCPGFYISGFRGRPLPPDERVFAVMHEATHSAAVAGSVPPESVGIDVAYSSTRLFGALEGSEAVHNTDSYVTALLTLARTAGGAPAAAAARRAAPVDVSRLTTPAGESGDRNVRARRAIGFAESWLNYASFWSPVLYDFLAASLTAWSPDGIGSLGHQMLQLFAPLYGLHHPGTTGIKAPQRAKIEAFQAGLAARGFVLPATSTHARPEDRTRAAGIYDRFTRMYQRLGDPLVVDRAAGGDGSWSSGTGLPGLGTECA